MLFIILQPLFLHRVVFLWFQFARVSPAGTKISVRSLRHSANRAYRASTLPIGYPNSKGRSRGDAPHDDRWQRNSLRARVHPTLSEKKVQPCADDLEVRAVKVRGVGRQASGSARFGCRRRDDGRAVEADVKVLNLHAPVRCEAPLAPSTGSPAGLYARVRSSETSRVRDAPEGRWKSRAYKYDARGAVEMVTVRRVDLAIGEAARGKQQQVLGRKPADTSANGPPPIDFFLGADRLRKTRGGQVARACARPLDAGAAKVRLQSNHPARRELPIVSKLDAASNAAHVEAVRGDPLLANKTVRAVDERHTGRIVAGVCDRAIAPAAAQLAADVESGPTRHGCLRHALTFSWQI